MSRFNIGHLNLLLLATGMIFLVMNIGGAQSKEVSPVGSPIASVTGTPKDLNDAGIAWVKEDVSDECTQTSYDFPASLVPIQDDAAATGGLFWRSFDKKVQLEYETKASYFLNVPGTTRSHFFQTTKCEPNNEMFKGGYFSKYRAKPRVTACEESVNKMRFSIRSAKQFCSTVYIIAPDDRDESRFLTNLELCGPLSGASLINSVSHRIFESISMQYRGCCKSTNFVNCYHQ